MFHSCFKKIRITNKARKKVPNEIQTELNLITQLNIFSDSTKCKIGKLLAAVKLKQAEASRNQGQNAWTKHWTEGSMNHWTDLTREKGKSRI